MTLETNRKKSSEETSNRCFTKPVFVPAEVQTELYTDMFVYCCLPAGAACPRKPKTTCTGVLSDQTKSPP